MAVSPSDKGNDVVRLTLFSDGTQLDGAVPVISVAIVKAVNRIPSARIVILDGDMPGKDFPVSNTDSFKPGAKIKINAGYGSEEETIFQGVVVRHGIKISGNNYSRLLVECKDQAVKLTIGRKNGNFVDSTDSDIIGKLIGNAGLAKDLDATTKQHKELVQYYCTDWDFILSRAEANGLLVIADDGKVSVKAPDTSATPPLKVTYGEDLMEFQADLDAESQLTSVKGVSWDMKTQAVVEAEQAPQTLNAQGDLASAALAGVVGPASYRLQTSAPADKDVLTAWAKGCQIKSGLARIRGRMKFQGSAKAKAGSLIELAGVGNRFNGTVFVTAVNHEIAGGNWLTEVEFGLSPDWFAEQRDIVAPPAAGLLPGVEGLLVGVVTKLDGDPEGENKIQVKVPVLQAETEGVWARLAQFYASDGIGAFFVPEIGDEVILGYFNNDPSHPVILGSLYSSKRKPPYALAAENNTKAIVTRSKMKMEFEEKDKVITISTPGNNKIVISDKDKSILIQDQNSNKVELKPDGIVLDSPKDITITAKGKITLDAVQSIGITAKQDVKTAGLNISSEAQVGFTAKGNATAELSASGQTTVKGAMVMIN
ncbi:MAG: type VI secretion system tip protein VgrG [Geobacter sp.]|nr:type VI secretion system tip protein VgrG [Geobacter sp.]